ncbi:Hypothetical_protein [Hexamita inflata]|uniref:Hypothetical_protein n=1 Tax=Hexamita inflata TaxID=28002 RepID=A0AA86RIM3_9EUKA|nr:Hypothetical protein HINF_LOCUS66245 [Hexamita inflata]
MGTGAIISGQDQITINYMNIISKDGTKITVSSELYILAPSSSKAVINYLTINLATSSSSGNITLINSITGTMTMTNYQISGSYYSIKSVALIGLTVSSVTATITNLTFSATNFNVGNYSSYLMSYVQSSTVTFNTVAILFGSAASTQIANQIACTDTNYYIFGGLVTYLTASTTVKINYLIYDAYVLYNADYPKNSGALIGYSSSSTNYIYIYKLCLNFEFSTALLIIESFGLIGLNEGGLSFTSSYITLYCVTGNYNMTGIIGNQTKNCAYSYISNVITTVNINSTAQGQIGAIFGYQEAVVCNIYNTVVNQSLLYADDRVGGFIGLCNNSVVTISNSIVENSIFTSTNYSLGGFIGSSYDCTYKISNSALSQIEMIGNMNNGVVLGWFTTNTFTITKSTSSAITINGNLLDDCASLTNTHSLTQCT